MLCVMKRSVVMQQIDHCLFSPRLFEFPRFAVHTPEGAKRIAASQGGGEYFCGRGPKLVLGEESATPGGRGSIQSRACVRGAAAGFSAWRDRKPEFSSSREKTIGICYLQ